LIVMPKPIVRTIPSDDSGFREHVSRIVQRNHVTRPSVLQAQLASIFPKVVVRARELSGENPVWYVYRDGRWTPATDHRWWDAPNLPRITVDPGGSITSANAGAMSLLGLTDLTAQPRRFPELVAPGAIEQATELLRVVLDGNDLLATVLIRPVDGEAIACEVHASLADGGMDVTMRLADDPDIRTGAVSRPTSVATLPESDVGFRDYVQFALGGMRAPSVDGLALRLRRLYPHARVERVGSGWVARRDAEGVDGPADAWWLDDALPTVTYDDDALIVDANEAAKRLLGSPLVGHHWQEFVTAGGSGHVAEFLPIIRRAGVVNSRFRMPRADGSLVDFDSHTEVHGNRFRTVMRPSS
jgi:PAS domain-containing protein